MLNAIILLTLHRQVGTKYASHQNQNKFIREDRRVLFEATG